MSPGKIARNLTPLFAVITLPIAILGGLFYGLTIAISVLVVGWLLLTPGSAILFDHPNTLGSGSHELDDEIEEVVQERITKRVRETIEEDEQASTDPIEELREQYARGEIDDVELEQRLDTLLEMGDVDPTDEESIERVKATFDTDNTRNESAETSDRDTSRQLTEHD